jgi:hypothetical protein
MRTALYALALGVLVLAAPSLQSQPKKSGAAAKLMVEKLKNAKILLEGIALADFDRIARSSEELLHLTNLEEWQVIKTPRYELFSNEFRRAAEAIMKKAKARNIDGVTLSYFEMTMSCVRCHQYVREVRDARLPVPPDITAVLARSDTPAR